MTNTDAAGGWNGDGVSQGGSPKEIASHAAQTVKQEAATFAAEAKDKATEQIEQHKETATKTLGDFADAIRRAGEELSSKDQSMASRLVQQAADGLESFSRSVSDKRPEEMLDAVRDFGRRNPTAFIAGSVLVGLAVGRFLRSSETATGNHNFTAPGGAPAIGLESDEMYASQGGDVTRSGATAIGAPASEFDTTLTEEAAEDVSLGGGTTEAPHFGGRRL